MSMLDGMSKGRALRKVQDTAGRVNIKGFFYDQYWQPIQAIFKALNNAEIPFAIEKAEYTKNRHGDPESKRWVLSITFTDDKGRNQTIWGNIVAAGAGSVEDPLDSYDVTANFS